MPSPLVSILIAALGLLAMQLGGRRSPLLTGITLATLLALPLLDLLPKVALPLPTGLPASNGATYLTLVAPAYLLGVGLLLLRLLLDGLALRRWLQQTVPCSELSLLTALERAQGRLQFSPRVTLSLHPQLASPVAVGLWHRRVILPSCAQSWQGPTAEAVLLHELGHHQRRDLWCALAARLACILHWFNPLAWFLRRQLLTQCEFACDRRVLATGIDAKRYAHTLCDLALPRHAPSPALAMTMATQSTLRDRVEHLLSPRRPLTWPAIGITLILTAGTAIALSTLRPSARAAFSPESLPLLQEAELRLRANPFPAN
ncbi:M56 family metallopeptidase [Roseibacillus ishigakijimensis]|uniref:M56 family metallopeptidase n=1 Tax=Roseibacillus ishigakijimensis TaxID=454146 RepID=A0A934RQF4_9BACT|nr:M56 family metallopeptidase [Roseibacillus ishigakijimensis]MBK1833696.1 M56 family metallopeptidase [Roseibacillus ishigakijimensis]